MKLLRILQIFVCWVLGGCLIFVSFGYVGTVFVKEGWRVRQWNWVSGISTEVCAYRKVQYPASGAEEGLKVPTGYKGEVDGAVSSAESGGGWPSFQGKHVHSVEEKEATGRRRCGTALLQGRRISQEDRIVCVPEIRLQIFGEEHAPMISLLAVFDGHGGCEASELAANSIYPQFLYHVYCIVGSLVNTLCQSNLDDCSKLSRERAIENRERILDQASSGDVFVHPMGRSSCGEERRNISSVLKTLGQNISDQSHPDLQLGGQHFAGRFEALRNWMASGKMDDSLLREVLRQALADAVSAIDKKISEEATKSGLESGSTASIVLYVDEYLLVANLGDSKALMCSFASSCTSHSGKGDGVMKTGANRRRRRLQKFDVGAFFKAEGDFHLCSKELTIDHRPERNDEYMRIVAAGGYIEDTGGVARVNGRLAVTRSMGDVTLKKYGITAEPEFSDWQRIVDDSRFLVVASDGIFEKMTPQDVCNILFAVSSGRSATDLIKDPTLHNGQAIPLFPTQGSETDNTKTTASIQASKTMALTVSLEQIRPSNGFDTDGSLSSDELDLKGIRFYTGTDATSQVPEEGVDERLAQAVVDTAFALGSMDNLAAIVLPLVSLQQMSSGGFSDVLDRPVEHVIDVTQGRGIALNPLYMLGKTNFSGQQRRPDENEKVSRQCYQLVKVLPRQTILPIYPTPDAFEGNSEGPWVIRKPSGKFEGGHQSVLARKQPPLQQLSKGRTGFWLDGYVDHVVCPPKQSELEQCKEVCLRPQGLSTYLRLVGSVPFDGLSLPASEEGSILGRQADPSILLYVVHHYRYLLKQSFAKGAFGEIWLGVRRDCAEESEEPSSFNVPHPGKTSNHSGCGNSSDEKYFGGWGEECHVNCGSNGDKLVFKRILVEKGTTAYMSGYREKHFGEIFLNATVTMARKTRHKQTKVADAGGIYAKERASPEKSFMEGKESSSARSFQQDNRNCAQGAHPCLPDAVMENLHIEYNSWMDEGLSHIARFVEAFERPGQDELWLVFQHEGQSLSKLLYVSEVTSSEGNFAAGFKMLRPSPWWQWLKTTEPGRREMRNLLRQLLLAVHACHARNITHRDIKPENMVVSPSCVTNGLPVVACPFNLTMRIIDFGSAMDSFTLQHLYGSSGPSRDEQTVEYSPPEALLVKHSTQFHGNKAHAYDMWSVGVVMLELVLGTPHVFQISARTRALLDQRLEGWEAAAKETAYMLRAFMELCILAPGAPLQRHRQHDKILDPPGEARLAPLVCSEAAFSQQIKQRDPLGLGMPDLLALRLVRRLLSWYPEDRPSAFEALQHPYFQQADPK